MVLWIKQQGKNWSTALDFIVEDSGLNPTDHQFLFVSRATPQAEVKNEEKIQNYYIPFSARPKPWN